MAAFSVGVRFGAFAALLMAGCAALDNLTSPDAPASDGADAANVDAREGDADPDPLDGSTSDGHVGSVVSVAIAAASATTCAIVGDGGAVCWGSDNLGQLGNGPDDAATSVPTSVVGLDDAVSITGSQNFLCALRRDGTVACWGFNSAGQIGDGTNGQANVPTTVKGLTDAVAIAAGYSHACAVVRDGRVFCWGANDHGQLGIGSSTPFNPPGPAVSSLTDAVAVAAGLYTTCAVRATGDVVCWGDNSLGQLGLGTDAGADVPMPVATLSGITSITSYRTHTCAIADGGKAFCWGVNDYGCLGSGSGAQTAVPVPVQGLDDAVTIAAGLYHTCATKRAGGVACWGNDQSGQIGDGVGSTRYAATAVYNIAAASAIAAGDGHACAITPGNKILCWGANGSGQLGGATDAAVSLPVEVVGY